MLPATSIEPALFWEGFSKLIEKFSPVNKKLLEKRSYLQDQINDWHKRQTSKEIDLTNYKKFLMKLVTLLRKKKILKYRHQVLIPRLGWYQDRN